jgi:hypothetical protein
VNIEAEKVEVFTEPRPRAGVYAHVRTVGKRDVLVSESLPEVSVPVRSLFS